MENSILDSTKKILGLDKEYLAFDLDIITYINAAFANLTQLGVGPSGGFTIDDSEATWDSYTVSALHPEQKSMVKTYVALYTRMRFDPPSTSFLIEATNKQIEEYEWRLNVSREDEAWQAS